MDLTGNTLSHANTCEGGNTPEVLLMMETTTSYYVEIGRDGTIYVPDPDGKSLDGSMTMAETISCADCGSRRAFTGLDGHYNPQIKWGKHAPAVVTKLEAIITKAMTDRQPNTPVNTALVGQIVSRLEQAGFGEGTD
jgi:hypothetical protein